MHIPLQVWLLFGTIAVLVVVIYVLVATIKQRILTHHLTLLAEDIHAVGRETLKKEPLRCTMCRHAAHVHLWQYGEKDTLIEVLLCSSCVSRTVKLLEPPSLLKGDHSHHGQQRERTTYGSRSRSASASR